MRRAWLTFVVVGGGPTGVELAGALAEISRHSLHISYLVGFGNRAPVLLRWGYVFLTRRRPIRLITATARSPGVAGPLHPTPSPG